MENYKKYYKIANKFLDKNETTLAIDNYKKAIDNYKKALDYSNSNNNSIKCLQGLSKA